MKFNAEQLAKFELELVEKGYKRYNPKYRNEDYSYWKSFGITYDEDNDEIIQYQIGLLVYDFSKYNNLPEFQQPFSVSYEFILGRNDKIDRVDLSISDTKLTVEEFEQVSLNFYNNVCNQWT
jgi:hypothetical protein